MKLHVCALSVLLAAMPASDHAAHGARLLAAEGTEKPPLPGTKQAPALTQDAALPEAEPSPTGEQPVTPKSTSTGTTYDPVASAFALPPRAVLTAKQAEAFAAMRAQMEPLLRAALEKVRQATDSTERLRAIEEVKRLREQIRVAIDNILHKQSPAGESPPAGPRTPPPSSLPDDDLARLRRGWAEEDRKRQEEQRRSDEQKRRWDDEDRIWKEQEKYKSEQERRQREADLRKREEEHRRWEAERRRWEAMQRQRQVEHQRHEAELKKKLEEEKRKHQADQKSSTEEARKRQEAEHKKAAEEAARKKAETDRKKADADRKKAEEEKKKRADAERKKREEDNKKKAHQPKANPKKPDPPKSTPKRSDPPKSGPSRSDPQGGGKKPDSSRRT